MAYEQTPREHLFELVASIFTGADDAQTARFADLLASVDNEAFERGRRAVQSEIIASLDLRQILGG